VFFCAKTEEIYSPNKQGLKKGGERRNMADKFFEEEEVIDEPQTIKLGEKEYSQDDLSRLVGLGEIAVELEDKWKTKIDRVFPEYTKATQALSDRDRKIAELEEKVNKPTQQAQSFEQLTAEQKEAARKQLEDLGYGQSAFRQIVREELAAKELLSDIDGLLSDAKDNGNPVTTPQDLLKHMSDTGIKNPTKAYRDMFESELDAIKEKKLAEIKPAGMVTTSASTAGSKQPAPASKPTNRNDLAKLVQEALSGQA
jgi:hypothetical protein